MGCPAIAHLVHLRPSAGEGRQALLPARRDGIVDLEHPCTERRDDGLVLAVGGVPERRPEALTLVVERFHPATEANDVAAGVRPGARPVPDEVVQPRIRSFPASAALATRPDGSRSAAP